MKTDPSPADYDQHREFRVSLRGQELTVISKPGIPNWDKVTPSTRLLAEAVRLGPADQVLLIGCSHGALAVCLARLVPHGSLKVVDASFISTSLASQTLKANHMENATVYETIPYPLGSPESFEGIVMELPKGRKLARRWLVGAYLVLKPGGSLYLAGPNQEGIHPAIKDAAALFGKEDVLAYRKGCRVARLVKNAASEPAANLPDWASEPGIQPGTWYEFKTLVHGKEYRIRSSPGVFSYAEVDEGTALLLESLKIPQESRVLDFGCGYGIIGMVASTLGAGNVEMVDSDLLAVASAQENIRINTIENTNAFPRDGLAWADEDAYDLLISNPPFHTGREVAFDVTLTLIDRAPRVLKPGGRLILVANRFIRYDRQIKAALGNVEVLAQNNRFHVLSGIRSIHKERSVDRDHRT